MIDIKHVLTDEQLIALGRVAAESSQLEHWVTELLETMYEDEIAKLQALQIKDKIKLWKDAIASLKAIKVEDKPKFLDIIEQIERVWDDRNTAIHGVIAVPKRSPKGYAYLSDLVGLEKRVEMNVVHLRKVSRKGDVTTISAPNLTVLADLLHQTTVNFWDRWMTLYVQNVVSSEKYAEMQGPLPEESVEFPA